MPIKTVENYSEPGQGATVRPYLPSRSAAEAVVEPPHEQEASPPRGGAEEIVLVVEDEPQVRSVSVAALRELGYTGRHAADGGVGLDMLEALPRMGGRELAETARRRRPDLKVLYTTGYIANAIVHNGAIDPGVALLSKPFSVDQLARKVRAAIDGGGSNRPLEL